MAVTTTTRDVAYTATGGESSYAVPFRFLEASHLLVKLNGTELTAGVHYSVVGAGRPSGSIVPLGLLVGALVIKRVVPFIQPTTFRLAGTFSPRAHEDAFDRQTMVAQQLQAVVDQEPLDRAAAIQTESLARQAAEQAIIAAGTQVGLSGASFVTAAGTSAARTLGARFSDTVNVLDFTGVDNSGVTDSRAGISAAIAATPAGGTLFFPPGDYKVSGGFVINRPIRVLGAGRKTRFVMTGISGCACLFYYGGAVPNGHPYADFASGTGYAFSGPIAIGATTLSGIASTTGLAIGDRVYLALGEDPSDPGQNHVRMWNVIESLTGTSITLRAPIPEAVSGTFTGSYGWAPAAHRIQKYTDIPEGWEFGNFAVEHSGSFSPDVVIFGNRARKIDVHDIFGINLKSTVLDFGDCELVNGRDFYIDRGGGIGVYGSRNVTIRNFTVKDLITASGLYLESQCRQVLLENVHLDSGNSSARGAGSTTVFVGGNCKGVKFRKVTLNRIDLANSTELTVQDGSSTPLLGDPNEVTFEDLIIEGDKDTIRVLPLGSMRGTLEYGGVAYGRIARWRKVVKLTNSMADAQVALPNMLVCRAWVKVTSKTGVQQVEFKNNGTTGVVDVYAGSGSTDRLPAAGSFARVDISGTFGLTSLGQFFTFNRPGAKVLRFWTGTVTPGATFTLVLEGYVTEDDSVDGSSGDSATGLPVIADLPYPFSEWVYATGSWTPGTIADGQSVSTWVDFTGKDVNPGDLAIVGSTVVIPQNCHLTCTAVNNGVYVHIFNKSGGPQTVGALTLNVGVIKV
jgi:hypothetical protein